MWMPRRLRRLCLCVRGRTAAGRELKAPAGQPSRRARGHLIDDRAASAVDRALRLGMGRAGGAASRDEIRRARSSPVTGGVAPCVHAASKQQGAGPRSDTLTFGR